MLSRKRIYHTKQILDIKKLKVGMKVIYVCTPAKSRRLITILSINKEYIETDGLYGRFCYSDMSLVQYQSGFWNNSNWLEYVI